VAGTLLSPAAQAHADLVLKVTRFDDPAPDGCTPTDCSLREAVIAANADPGADTIKLSIGTYPLQIPGPGENASATGDLDLVFPVRIEGAGADKTTISGKGNGDRIIHFPYFATGPVTISGLTIRDGVNESTQTGAESGAGISMESFRSGIRALEEMTLRGVHVTSNLSDGSAGGISNSGGVLTITDSTFSRNRALREGGGLWLSTVVTLTNVTVSDNTAGGRGGGIFMQGSWPDGEPNDVRIENSTITANWASPQDGGGGISALFGTTAIRNTIIAGNKGSKLKPESTAPDCLGTLLADAYNLIGTNQGCDGLGGTDQFGTSAAPLSPMLTPLGGGTPAKPGASHTSGGPTPTHVLLQGSPAIDRGSPSPPGSTDTACSYADQRGMPRPQGGACDIGAYELGLCWGVPVNRIGTAGPDDMQGSTMLNESFLLFSGDDTVNGGGGNDMICGGEGDDVLTGGVGDDRLDGGPGVDTATFSEMGKVGLTVDLAEGIAKGNWMLPELFVGIENAVGSPGQDTIRGDAGSNILDGLGGKDFLFGLEGDDLLLGGEGPDRTVGGPGDDWLAGEAGPDYLLGGSGVDLLIGGSGRDLLFGHGGSDSLHGGAAGDELIGGPGDDALRGAGGRDLLRGGWGFDSCIGGRGRDFKIGCETSFPFLK
jgi:CSLREA domain-containing protein